MAENGYSWSHGLWLFRIIGFDNVLLAPKQAEFILVCGPIKQSLLEGVRVEGWGGNGGLRGFEHFII